MAQKGDLGKWLDLVQIHRLNSDLPKPWGVRQRSLARITFCVAEISWRVKPFVLERSSLKHLELKGEEDSFILQGGFLNAGSKYLK